MLHRCFSMTIIFLTFASPPFCCVFSVSIPCCVWTQRAVSKGLNWLLNAFIFQCFQVFWSWLHVSSVRLCTIISHPVILCLLKLSKMIFSIGRQTSVSKETSMTFTSLLTIFRPSYISLFVSLPLTIHRLLCFVKFSVCQPHSVWPCLCVYVCERKRVCVCVYGRLYSQVAYEFHLSAARGALLRISPNGLVCNCSVNTCLSRQWRAEGKRPLTLWTEATYWAANSYLPPDRKGERRPQLR